MRLQGVAESSYFLPLYDLRQATAAAAALRQRLAEVSAALQPRRRFGFSKALKKTSPLEQQPLAEPDAAPSPSSQGAILLSKKTNRSDASLQY